MVFHGGAKEGEENLLDFSYSVNPYRPPFLKRLLNTDLTVYPYCESLENKIKEKYGIDNDVLIGAGITELLYMASFAMRGKDAMFMVHTYGEYERMANLFGMKSFRVKDLDPPMESFSIKEGVIFFSNPNNPTGKYYSNIEDLFYKAERNNSIVVLDEAFIDFSERRPKFYPDNVIVLRSFTKSFGLPGIRAGYAFGERRIIDRMREFRMPWSLGGLGCKFIWYALRNDGYLKASLEKIWKERRRIEYLTNLRTHANFFLAYSESGDVWKKLRERGVLVRDCSSFGLQGSIRFAIRKKRENDILLKELSHFNLGLPKGIDYDS
ncbi:MAG: aminotransferase class I/II-fold pyridoxal phosphate-dependent enzyme [Thermoplasmata archaeon]|jgi:histidinol-phosphate aminotransferase|nr:aminotransferase class I/II-fold pyridoxal phosphate-dependent enzyme [Thermoplasmatales archaeon]